MQILTPAPRVLHYLNPTDVPGVDNPYSNVGSSCWDEHPPFRDVFFVGAIVFSLYI